MDIKKFIRKVKLNYELSYDTKEKIIEAGYGSPIEMISKKRESFTYSSNLPSEYFSRIRSIYTYIILTNKNNKIKVIEEFDGDGYDFEKIKVTIEIQ